MPLPVIIPKKGLGGNSVPSHGGIGRGGGRYLGVRVKMLLLFEKRAKPGHAH